MKLTWKHETWAYQANVAEAIHRIQRCSHGRACPPWRVSRAAVGNSIEGIHDFDVSKRFEGDGFNFTASMKF